MKNLIAKIKYHAHTALIILTVIGFGVTVFVAAKWADYNAKKT